MVGDTDSAACTPSRKSARDSAAPIARALGTPAAAPRRGGAMMREASPGGEVPIAAVFADRTCRALKFAEESGSEAVLVERTDFSKTFDRDAYCEQLVGVLRGLQRDLIVSAGFGTVIP